MLLLGTDPLRDEEAHSAWCVAETRNTQTRPVEVVGGLNTSEPYPTISMLHSLVAAGSLFPVAHAATVTVPVRMESTQDHKICIVCAYHAAERLAGRSNRDERSTSQFLRANSPIMTQQSRKPTAQPSESCSPSSRVSLLGYSVTGMYETSQDYTPIDYIHTERAGKIPRATHLLSSPVEAIRAGVRSNSNDVGVCVLLKRADIYTRRAIIAVQHCLQQH